MNIYLVPAIIMAVNCVVLLFVLIRDIVKGGGR